ncbi:hypothetical protein MTMN5_00023 [Marinobacter salarius]|jgi:membrane protease YdiL (CAAX protease family)|nr:hypothetical protein MTMN5_00023 [Marinobacter salarius]
MDSNFLTGACIFTFVYSLGAAYGASKKGMRVAIAFFLLCVFAGSTLTYAYYGIGNTWDGASEFGKAASLVLAVATPLILASIPVALAARLKYGDHVAFVSSVVLGTVGVFILPFVGVVLACLFTGDCL